MQKEHMRYKVPATHCQVSLVTVYLCLFEFDTISQQTSPWYLALSISGMRT